MIQLILRQTAAETGGAREGPIDVMPSLHLIIIDTRQAAWSRFKGMESRLHFSPESRPIPILRMKAPGSLPGDLLCFRPEAAQSVENR